MRTYWYDFYPPSLYVYWIQDYSDKCTLKTAGRSRYNEVYEDMNSLHSSGLKDVYTQHQSLLSAQFSLSKVKVPRNLKLSGFASHD